MKKTSIILMLMLFVIILTSISGCSKPEQDVNNHPTQSGNTETFTHDGLKLEVTNVHDIRVESMVDDGGTPWEYSIFVCYPGANITILAADMNDGSFTDDGKPCANWGIELSSDERIRIVDDMNSFDVTPDIVGIYNLESSLYALKFEMVELSD